MSGEAGEGEALAVHMVVLSISSTAGAVRGIQVCADEVFVAVAVSQFRSFDATWFGDQKDFDCRVDSSTVLATGALRMTSPMSFTSTTAVRGDTVSFDHRGAGLGMLATEDRVHMPDCVFVWMTYPIAAG